MHIAIMGLGYVGATTAACLLKGGHHVYGIDISREKVALVGDGRSPVVEPEVEELLQAGLASGRLASGPSLEPWLDRLDLVLVCVPARFVADVVDADRTTNTVSVWHCGVAPPSMAADATASASSQRPNW